MLQALKFVELPDGKWAYDQPYKGDGLRDSLREFEDNVCVIIDVSWPGHGTHSAIY